MHPDLFLAPSFAIVVVAVVGLIACCVVPDQLRHNPRDCKTACEPGRVQLCGWSVVCAPPQEGK
jgi:hypothetical protein